MILPELFVERMKIQLEENYTAFEKAIQEPPIISIRYNQLKQVPKMVGNPVLWHEQGIYLDKRPVFALDPLWHAGGYYVQEASSMFVAKIVQETLNLKEKLKVLDLCAAPGGKSTLLADLLNEESLLIANEVIRSRVSVLKENLIKWGFLNTIIANHDSEDFVALKEYFDLVLVDAPCSGEGLFRKDKTAVEEWSINNVMLCSSRQKRILENAVNLIHSEGILIYATCTYNVFENKQNCEWLVQQFDLEGISLDIPEQSGIEKQVFQGAFGYQFYPHKVRGEGFFVAPFKKRKTTKLIEHLPLLEKQSKKEKKQTPVLDFQQLTTKEISLFQHFIKNDKAISFFLKPNQEVIALKNELLKDYQLLQKVLKRNSLGLVIGELKKNVFIPSHDLAMSSLLSQNVPKLSLSLEEALLFLKGDVFKIPETPLNGWVIVTYLETPLGWIKTMPNRINNYYPKDWRLRLKNN